MEIDLAKARLAFNGIEAADHEKLKEIASRNNTKPIEILKVMLVEGYLINR